VTTKRVMPHGINRHYKDGHCIAVGCERVALYRAAAATKGGYCKVHKSLAVEHAAARSRSSDAYLRGKGEGQ